MTWEQWMRRSLLPRSGGWQDQPLGLLIQAQAIEATLNLHRKMRSDTFDWTTLSANEVALTKWMGIEAGE